MKENILLLRSQGKTYNEIRDILNCSKSTISYYCGDKQKEKNSLRVKRNRDNKKQLKNKNKLDYKRRRVRESKLWYNSIHYCKNCEIKIDNFYGSGTFCTEKCAKSYSTKNKKNEISKKKSLKLKGRKMSKSFSQKISRINHSRTKKIKNKIRDTMKLYFLNNPEHYKKTVQGLRNAVLSDKGRKLLSKNAINRGLGGHTSKSKLYYKTKAGEVVYLHSSYEIRVANSLDENNIKWERPRYLEWVDDNNCKHKYYGDFYLNDYFVYLDTKNDFLIKKDEAKIKNVIQQNKIKLLVINKNELDWKIIKNLIGD